MIANLNCYIRPHRRQWGLSQSELANLLGLKDGASISRLERGLQHPSLETAYAIKLILGVTHRELFPDLHMEVRRQVNVRIRSHYDSLQGDSSTLTKLKLDLFEAAFARLDESQ